MGRPVSSGQHQYYNSKLLKWAAAALVDPGPFGCHPERGEGSKSPGYSNYLAAERFQILRRKLLRKTARTAGSERQPGCYPKNRKTLLLGHHCAVMSWRSWGYDTDKLRAFHRSLPKGGWLRPGMAFFVFLMQVRVGQVGIYLGGGNTGVTQEFLYMTEGGPVLE